MASCVGGAACDQASGSEVAPRVGLPPVTSGFAPPMAFPLPGPPPLNTLPVSSICGNGRREPGENCDDGNRTANDGCSPCCDVEIVGAPSRSCVLPAAAASCGNGRLEAPERCDDGNSISGDGCSNTCVQVEPGFACPVAGAPCHEIVACGDAIVSEGEACDHARTPNGCSRQCEPAQHFVCNSGQCTYSAICGNGVRDGYETCDDGNTLPGDGCSTSCLVEDAWRCPDVGAPCLQRCNFEPSPIAPSGSIAAPEPSASDEHPGASSAGTSDAARPDAAASDFEDAGVAAPYADSATPGVPTSDPSAECKQRRLEPYCGDGVVDPGEDCDDGLNADPYFWEVDDCGPDCRWPPYCGDGYPDVAFGEECDPGDGLTGVYGGCGEQCTLAAHCGDGLVEPEYEACDDGNRVDGDGCPWDCGTPNTR